MSREQLTGPVGTTTPCPVDEAQPHSVAGWFLTLPEVDPLEHHFLLYAVDLAPDPALRPVSRLAPAADFEIGLVALDPHAVPTADQPERWQPLMPAQMVFQFSGLNRAGVAEFARRVALWLIGGSRWAVTTGNAYEQRGWAQDLAHELKLLADCPKWTAASPDPAQGRPVAGSDLPGDLQ